MLLKVKMTLASRQIVGMVLDGVRKDITVDKLRMIKEIRRKLDLRECQRAVDKESKERDEKYGEIKKLADLIMDPRERSVAMYEAPLPLTWDDLMGVSLSDEEREKLSDDALLKHPIKEFTLDSSYINFLQTELDEQLKDKDHHFAGMEVMAASLKEAIACLADELKYAEPVNGVQP